MESAGDHQMKDQPEIVIHADRNALAYASQFADDATFRVGKRRLGGSQEESALQAYTFEGLADYSGFQCGDIGSDVGQFWHAGLFPNLFVGYPLVRIRSADLLEVMEEVREVILRQEGEGYWFS